jgi:hypothetical protein
MATNAAAQDVTTCGWHFLDATPRPPAVQQLLERAPANADVQAVVQQLDGWYARCDATAAREAALELRRLVPTSGPARNVARGLLGIALVRGPEVQVERASGQWLRATHAASNAERDGVRLLADVLVETGWPEVAQELAAVAIATRKAESLRDARAALITAAARRPALNVYLADVLLALGAGRDARARALATLPLTAAAQRIAAVSSLRDSTISAGAGREYLDALAAARERDVLHAFFDDIRLLLDAQELREWATLKDGHAAWLQRRWEWRAFLAGVPIEQRLATHQQRLVSALRDYHRLSQRGAPVPSALSLESRDSSEPLDDRGLLYLRHGPPETTLQARGAQRVAWVYRSPAGYRIFEFGRNATRSDYYLLEPHPVCGGRHVITGQQERAPYPSIGDRLDWAMALGAYDRAMSDYYARCESGSEFASLHYTSVIEEAHERASTAFSTETAVPQFPRPLLAAVNLYAFPAGTGTELIAYTAVPVRALKPASTNPQVYSIDMRFAVGNDATSQVVQRDTTLTFTLPAQVATDASAAFPMALNVPWATDARVAIALTNAVAREEGQFLTTRKPLAGSAGAQTSSSDIVIADMRDGTLRRGDNALAPLLGHAVPMGAQFRVYYELRGLTAGDSIRTDITVSPARDTGGLLQSLISRRRAVSVSFQEDAAVSSDGILRSLREFRPDLEPGSYLMTITTTKAVSGARVVAETNLTILPR